MEVGVIPVRGALSVRHPRARRCDPGRGRLALGDRGKRRDVRQVRRGVIGGTVDVVFHRGFLAANAAHVARSPPAPAPSARSRDLRCGLPSIGPGRTEASIAPSGTAHARGVSGPSVDTSLADQRGRPVDARAIANEPRAPIPRAFPLGRMAPSCGSERPCVRRFDKSDALDKLLDWVFLSPADCFFREFARAQSDSQVFRGAGKVRLAGRKWNIPK